MNDEPKPYSGLCTQPHLVEGVGFPLLCRVVMRFEHVPMRLVGVDVSLSTLPPGTLLRLMNGPYASQVIRIGKVCEDGTGVSFSFSANEFPSEEQEANEWAERRRSFRAPCSLSCSWSTLGASGPPRNGLVLDLSGHGLCLSASRLPEELDELLVGLPSHLDLLVLRAKLVRAIPAAKGYRLGCEFVGLSTTIQDQLFALVFELQRNYQRNRIVLASQNQMRTLVSK